MAVWCVRSAVVDLAGLGDVALDGVEVLADVAADGDTQDALLEGGAEARVEFGFEGGGELAEVDLAGGATLARRSRATTEFLDEVVTEADACAGVIEADFAAALEARAEDLELFGGAGVFQAEDLSRDKKRLRIEN